MTCRTVNSHIDVWEREIILRTSLVEILKINTNSYLAVLFRNMDDIGQPFGYSTTDKNHILSCF